VSPDQVLILITIVTAAWTGTRILRPIAEALGRRIGASPAPGPAADHEAEITDLHRRLAELEERVDFAERLLGQRQPGELGKESWP
jgi:hypothetical protein